MKNHISILVLILLAAFATARADLSELPAAKNLTPVDKQSQTIKLISYLLDKIHYRKLELDNEFGAAVLTNYIEHLDPSKIIFTQEDVARFLKSKDKFDDYISNGKLHPAFSIFDIMRLRTYERVEFALARLEQPFDFSKDENYLFDRKQAGWQKNKNALNEIWRKRIKNDILNLRATDKSDDEIKKLLRARYKHLVRRTLQFKAEDVFEIFINSYTTAIDPHTNYFLPRARENFEINMRLSLEGIGAVLQTDNEYVQIRRIIPGGPADKGGQLKADDRVIGVGQAQGEIVDVIGWRLDEVVELIRGPKGSTVWLSILDGDSSPDAQAKIISIRRDKINLEDQAAKKRTLQTPTARIQANIGVIELPSFYSDFQGMRDKRPDYRSTTRDVRNLLSEFKDEGIDGLIIDLRGNSGGALDEAVALTGLFIKRGAVVQVKDARGKVRLNRDPDPEIVYSGPLAVLVDGYSASASEIFAGAIQDYKRGLVIGAPTFGKGTVQHLLDLNRYMKTESDIGQLKATVAQFFRVAGDSTQYRGVIPDIQFPRPEDADEYSERRFKNSIPWQKIDATGFQIYQDANGIATNFAVIDYLNKLHAARASSDAEFKHFRAYEKFNLEARRQTQISLQQSKRDRERKAREQQKLDIENQLRVALGRAPVADYASLQDQESDDGDAKADLFLRESVRIMGDYLDAIAGGNAQNE